MSDATFWADIVKLSMFLTFLFITGMSWGESKKEES
jgi:hypothetical protein